MFGFPKEWIAERKLYNFNKIKVYGPKDPLNLLHFMYGKDCMTVCKEYAIMHTGNTTAKNVNVCSNLPQPQL
jgi:hypothetical protein